MTSYRTEQEAFWAGDFGTDYARRNDGPAIVASNASLFARALRRAGRIESCLEFGANIGMNLQALNTLFPAMRRFGIEVNDVAAGKLAALIGEANVYRGSILDYPVVRQFDLAFVKGVLIHIDPDSLPVVYDKIYAASSRWILVCEYYSPVPVMIPYRGHQNRLYKRDFAGDMLERYAQLRLADYGFVYRRDPAFPQDDVTWFLLEKRACESP